MITATISNGRGSILDPNQVDVHPFEATEKRAYLTGETHVDYNFEITSDDMHLCAAIYADEGRTMCIDSSEGVGNVLLTATLEYKERCWVVITSMEEETGSYALEIFPNLPVEPDNIIYENLEADPVDVSSGAHLLEFTLGELCGGQNIKLVAKYNSSSRPWGSLGKGWYHNYEKSITMGWYDIKVFERPCAYHSYTYNNGVYTCNRPGRKNYVLTVSEDNKSVCLDRGDEGKEYYDRSTGRLMRVVSRQGFETELVYDSEGFLSEIIDKVTNQKITLENNEFFITRVSSPGRGMTEFTYERGCVVEAYDSGDFHLRFTYDEFGRVLTGTDNMGTVYFQNTYSPISDIVQTQKDAFGKETTFSYETREITLGSEEEDSPSDTPLDDTIRSKNIKVKTCTVTQRDGTTCIRDYDSNSLLVAYTDGNGNRTTYEYNDNGQLTKETDALNRSKTREYDTNYRLIKETDKNENEKHYSYDTAGNLLTVSHCAKNGVPVVLKSFTYNENNQVLTCTDERGTVTTYTYDENRMPLTKTVGTHTSAYVYENGFMKSQTDPRNQTTEYTYVGGRVSGKKDPLNRNTAVIYNLHGDILGATDPLGNSRVFGYDANYCKAWETDANGNRTEYEHNGNLKLTKVTYADGGELIHEYDDMDRIIKTTDPEENETTYLYDPAGRLVCKTLPDGNQYCYIYDAVGNVLEEGISKVELDFSEGLDALQAGFAAYGKITRTYDANGNILTQIDQNGLTTFEYDSMNRVVKKTAANGGITRYTYSLAGDLLTVTDPLNHTVTYTYDAYGNKVTMTDPKGNITSYAYDANNNLIRTTDAFGSVQYEYDACNQLVKLIDQASNETVYGYDAAGRRTTVTDPAGKTVTTAYDAMGNVLSIADPVGITRTVAYNNRNLPCNVEDANGTFSYEYNKLGKVTKITDLSSWMEKLFEYDSMGRVIKVTDEDGRESTATYHALGKPLTALCPNGGGTTYEYDDYGRVISESLEEGCTRSYYYDELGRLAGFLNGREDIQPEEAEMITFGYGYDAAGRLISQTAPDEDYGYVYDDNGNLLRVTDPKGNRTYTYDAKNRVTSYEDASGNCIEYTYDNRGNLITLEYPDHTEVHYQYDSCNRLISVIDWEDRETKYTYFDNGKLRKIENANGTVAEFEYDDWARPVGQEERTGEGNLILLQNWSRDGVGQVVQENQVFYDPTDPENSVDFEREMVYNYCDNRWLNDVEKDGSLETHSYDDGGNLVQGSRYTYNDANRLIAFDNSPLIYDNDGNIENVMIGDTDLWLEYDSRNRLFCSDGEVIADYEYSPQNLLEKRTVDGIETEYVYDPLPRLSRLLMKTTDDVTTKYVYGLGLIGEEVDGEFKTYHYDYRGSTVAITEDDGSIIDTFEYDTYGKLLSHVGETDTPFCYNGRDGVMTEPNGLYYMRNRFYSPDLKRFINPDLLAGDITNAITLNRYAYANNNPVSFVDPLGLSAERGQYGSIIYKGYEYYIHVPTHSSRPVIESVWETVDEKHYYGSMFDLGEFMASFSLESVSPEASVTKAQYLSRGGVSIAASYISALYNASDGLDLYFRFQENGDQRRVIIMAGSNKMEAFNNRYSNDKLSIMGNGSHQERHRLRNEYETLTGEESKWFESYAVAMTRDKRHKGSRYHSYLWIDGDGNLMMTPIIYSNDKLEFLKADNFFSGFETVEEYQIDAPIMAPLSYAEIFAKNVEGFEPGSIFL